MLNYPCVPQDDYSTLGDATALAVFVIMAVFCYFTYTSYNDDYINQSESSITAKETPWHATKALSHQKKQILPRHQKSQPHHQAKGKFNE